MTITLEDGPLRVAIEPQHGAALSALDLAVSDGRSAPLLRPATAETPWWAGSAMYLLAPWSNRIAGAAFEFEGRRYALHPDFFDGTAIHGIVKDHPFEILDRTPISARLGFDSRRVKNPNFPFAFQAVARYELDGPRLECELSVHNAGHTPMPAGCGFHPFFMRTLFDPDESVTLQAPVSGRYPADGCVPTAPPADGPVCAQLRDTVAVSELALDDCFAGFAGRATITWPGSAVRAQLRCSPTLTHAVVYTPDEPFFCFEPVTHANDGFNILARGGPHSGTVVLAPGDALVAQMILTVETD